MPEVVKFVIIVGVVVAVAIGVVWLWYPRTKNQGESKRPPRGGPNPGPIITRGPDRLETQLPPSIYHLRVVKVLEEGPAVGTTYRLREGYNKIGRQPRREDKVHLIKIREDPAISQDHAYLIMEADGTLFWENCSSKGSWIDGQRLSNQEKRSLDLGTEIKIGGTLLCLEQEGHHPTTPLAPPTKPSLIRGRFQIIAGPNKGETFVIERLPLHLGRDTTNQWQLEDASVSRQHARLFQEGALLKIENLSQTYDGLKINGHKVKVRTLEDGDKIQLGKTILVFERLDR